MTEISKPDKTVPDKPGAVNGINSVSPALTSNGSPSATSAKTSNALVHVPVPGVEAQTLASHSTSLSNNAGLSKSHVGLANNAGLASNTASHANNGGLANNNAGLGNNIGLASNIGLANDIGLGSNAGLASVDSLLILSKFDELITEIRGLRDELKDFKGQQAAAAAAAAEAAKDSGVRKETPDEREIRYTRARFLWNNSDRLLLQRPCVPFSVHFARFEEVRILVGELEPLPHDVVGGARLALKLHATLHPDMKARLQRPAKMAYRQFVEQCRHCDMNVHHEQLAKKIRGPTYLEEVMRMCE